MMTEKKIEARIKEVKQSFNDVVFRIQELDNGSWVVIMRGGLEAENPTEYMNNAVYTLVRDELHNEFIEKFLDNPWIRIIIFNFNGITFK